MNGSKNLFGNVGQASSLPVHGASSPRVSGGRMPPELADKMSSPHFKTGSKPLQFRCRFVRLSPCFHVWGPPSLDRAQKADSPHALSLRSHGSETR